MGVLIFLVFVHEESPIFLWSKGRRQQSFTALKWYRKGCPPDMVIDEFKALENINSSGSSQNPEQNQCCSAFAREETLKPFIIVMALLGLVPLTGIMSVTFFAMELFEGT